MRKTGQWSKAAPYTRRQLSHAFISQGHIERKRLALTCHELPLHYFSVAVSSFLAGFVYNQASLKTEFKTGDVFYTMFWLVWPPCVYISSINTYTCVSRCPLSSSIRCWHPWLKIIIEFVHHRVYTFTIIIVFIPDRVENVSFVEMASTFEPGRYVNYSHLWHRQTGMHWNGSQYGPVLV